MISCLRISSGFALMFVVCTTEAHADIQLAHVFSDGLVLQRERDVAIYGTGSAEEKVVVRASFFEGERLTYVDEDGAWAVKVPTGLAGGPHTITVDSSSTTLQVANVLVGEVWIASGQSNMEMPIGNVGGGYTGVLDWEAEALRANAPDVRVFVVENALAAAPALECNGAWKSFTAAEAKELSATGCFFARELHTALGVPIGIVATDWGGTPAEAWTSAQGLKEFPRFQVALSRLEFTAGNPEGAAQEASRAVSAWRTRFEEVEGGVARGVHRAEFDDSTWKTMEVPATWAGELADFDGVVWLRTSFDVPKYRVQDEATLELGPIDDLDATYVNGVLVGERMRGTAWQEPRAYPVPKDCLRAGRNSVAVRVFDTGGRAGINAEDKSVVQLRYQVGAATPLAGSWRYEVGAAAASLPPLPTPLELNPGMPSSLYNAMIAPLARMTFRGAIWYQGESNRGHASEYSRLFPALIRDWRRLFGQGDFPFYFVQLAPFAYDGDKGQTGELREAQRLTLRALPNTGMVVTMDIGDEHDIHPLNKQEVGRRLALLALANTYGRELACSGPMYREAKVEGGSIRIAFDHATGLTSAEKAPTCFAIAGADGVFVPAEARIDGASVVVQAATVSAPRWVRFAQGDRDVPNLKNAAGLPASPFRTDDLPWITR